METPADIVNEFYETCNSKQGQGMEAFVADDIEFEGPAMKISGGKKYVEVVKPLLHIAGLAGPQQALSGAG